MRLFSSIRNRFLKWLLRCAAMGLLIGTLYGIVFLLFAVPKALLIIPLVVGLSVPLACISWPAASLAQKYPKSRLARILEGAVHGVVVGALMLMPFSNPWQMTVYQALGGGILGGVLGTVFATALRWKTPRAA